MCSFQKTLVKEATAKASGRAAEQKRRRFIWAEHPCQVSPGSGYRSRHPGGSPTHKRRRLRPGILNRIAAPSRWCQKLASGVPAGRQGPRSAAASLLELSTSSAGP